MPDETVDVKVNISMGIWNHKLPWAIATIDRQLIQKLQCASVLCAVYALDTCIWLLHVFKVCIRNEVMIAQAQQPGHTEQSNFVISTEQIHTNFLFLRKAASILQLSIIHHNAKKTYTTQEPWLVKFWSWLRKCNQSKTALITWRTFTRPMRSTYLRLFIF